MLSVLFFVALFAIAYPLKGGQGDDVFSGWNDWEITRLGDKAMSVLFLAIGLCLYTFFSGENVGITPNVWLSIPVVLIGWLGAISPPVNFTSAVEGDLKQALKDGFVRGSVIGACMALVTGSVIFIPFAWLYGLIAFLGFKYRPSWWRLDSWAWIEVFIGALCFGLPMGLGF